MMRTGFLQGLGSMATLAAFVAVMWPGAADAIECSNDHGSCTIEVLDNGEEGSCTCADCTPSLGWGSGSPDGEPMPEPTEEYCLEMLEMHCTEEPVTEASQVCAADEQELCESGLADWFLTCEPLTKHVEGVCVTVACCHAVQDIGMEAASEFWSCATEYGDCDQAVESCFDEEDGTPGGDDDSGGYDTGDDGEGTGGGDDGPDRGEDDTGTGNDDPHGDEDDPSGDKKGCSIDRAGDVAPLALVPLLALARRRRR